uniref:Methylcytosine dioxygenase TET n=1 Tax=Monopterus albus TaxID=43700 RepID=A0A3Q3ICL0_MONAL
METEEARHETEESLILAQFGTSQNCNNSASGQRLFDQGSYTMNRKLINGELKHGLTEQSLVVHQPKKLKVDSEIKGNGNIGSPLVDNISELTKAAGFEIKLDKQNSNFPNGDIFCLPRNKQVSLLNGAISPPSTIESTSGDLLEQTLSQYYPEQVSIAPQTPGSQLDGVNGSLANKLPSEGAKHCSITSGLPNSGQMPDSQQEQPGASGNNEGGNIYKSSYVVNGHSNNFGADHQQQQQHQQQPPLHSGQELSLRQLPGIMSPTHTANSLHQHQNGPQCYSGDKNPQGIYKLGQSEEPGSGQHHGTDKGHQYGIQPKNFTPNTRNSCEADSTGNMRPSRQQPLHAELKNGLENTPQQSGSLSCSTTHQREWMELNSSHSQQETASGPASQAHEQDIWRGFPAKPQSEQKTANPHGQMLEENPRQRFQTLGGPQMASRDLAPSRSSRKVSQLKHPVLQSSTTLPLSGNSQILKHLKCSSLYQPQPDQQQLQPNQPLRNNYFQPNKQHIQHSNQATCSYNNPTDMQLQHQRQFPPNSCSNNLKQFQPQQPKNHCHQSNHVDFPQTSTQSQPHLPQSVLNQHVSTQMYPKAEQQLKTSCTQFQRGPQLPQEPVGPHGDFQKHAALRMHLLQKQERQGPLHSPKRTSDPTYSKRAVKMENEPRFELPGPQQQQQQQQQQRIQMQEPGIGGMQVKQENQLSLCDESKRQGSILASMEQSLRQYQLSPVFKKKSITINSSNKVKVESCGPVTILSTNTDLNEVESPAAASATVALKKSPDSTSKKEHLLQSFMDSPMKLLDTPLKNLLDTPMKTQYDIASCHCVEQICEKDEGPYYTHLGSAPTVAGIRELMENRSGLTGRAIRIEKVVYTGKEGKSTQGCPIAKWVIRRSSVEEKLLVLVRERARHTCETACIIVVILFWEGIQPSLADRLYAELSETLTKHGALTQRRCALNEERTCACQGLNPDTCGASFSFGCSWSMYYNGCKFARSKIPRKFKLLVDDAKEEEKIENNFQNLATLLAPLYKTLAPEAYGTQVEHENRAPDCRLGVKEGRPFSGVTACLDFCAHAHRDLHNMQGGSTVVCTLTREDNREIGKIPEDEQLHVLPLYKASNTDEFGSEEGQQEKIKSGAIQVLSAFRRQVRMLAEPAKSCRQKKLEAKKAAANKNAMLDSSNDKTEKALAKSKASTYENTTQSTHMPTHPLGAHPQQQQHQNILPCYPGSANAAVYPRFPNHPGSFPSTSKQGSMYPPRPSTPGSPYTSRFQVPNSCINGSNQGYQCSGGMPLDNYHPYYASNPKHLDMYRQQRPALYSEQQYSAHGHYEFNYLPRYGEPGLQVSGYNACNMRPVHSIRPYTPYGSNVASESQFIDPLSRAPSAHGGLDYTASVSKGGQFGGYSNPYLSGSCQLLPPSLSPDSFHMQIKTEMGMAGPQMLSSQLSSGCLNHEMQSGLGLHNGNLIGSGIKQEPGTPQTTTTPQKPEVWSDNEHNFLDPDIGGVAVAPSHGSVLIECAKRELHATTPIKNPDRNNPTRISLVFYQHKNMNEAKHGLALWETKMAEKAREKEEDAEKNGGEGTPSKGGKKGVKRDHSELSEITGEPPYKRFIQALTERSLSCTTNTHVSTSPYAFTKVTGPYSHFV